MQDLTRKTLIVIASLLGATATARAETWPQRPVTVVVPQAAGSSPDVLCRIIAEKLSRAFGQQFVVENRTGAANVIGTQSVARAQPDGYTFLFATSAALVTNPYTFKNLSYNPERDFSPVAMVARSHHVLVVAPSLKATTLSELIALEKSKPGTLNMAIDGPRNLSGILGQYMNKVAGTTFQMVPYNNITNAIQDTIAGRTEAAILSASIAEPHIKAGSMRPLAVAGSKRIDGLPGVPALSETFPDVRIQGWFMIMAPAGTPDDILRKVSTEVARILKEPDVQAQAPVLGFDLESGEVVTPDGARKFLATELAETGKVIKELGIEPQ